MNLKKLKNLSIASLVFGIITLLFSFTVVGIRLYIQFAFVGKTGLGVAIAALAWSEILLYVSIAYLVWFLINLSLYIYVFVKLHPYKENPHFALSIIGFIFPVFQVVALILYIVKINKLIKTQVLESDNDVQITEILN